MKNFMKKFSIHIIIAVLLGIVAFFIWREIADYISIVNVHMGLEACGIWYMGLIGISIFISSLYLIIVYLYYLFSRLFTLMTEILSYLEKNELSHTKATSTTEVPGKMEENGT